MTEYLKDDIKDESSQINTQLISNIISTSVSEMISIQPPFFVRKGQLIILAVFIIFFASTFFIKFPERVSVEGKISASAAPYDVKVSLSGKLIDIYVSDGQYVRQNQLIGILESSASAKDVFNLSGIIDSLEFAINNGNQKYIIHCLDNNDFKLGELESDFIVFNGVFLKFKNGVSKKLFVNDNVLKKGRSAIFKKNVDGQEAMIIHSIQAFRQSILNWKEKYLLVSPANGNVSFCSLLEKNSELKSGEIFCKIIPDSTKYYAVIAIPQFDLKKVKLHQKIQLKIQHYPFTKFGIIEGEINMISKVLTDKGYLARANLSSPLLTNLNMLLPYNDSLTVSGEIITNDARLSDKLINQFKLRSINN